MEQRVVEDPGPWARSHTKLENEVEPFFPSHIFSRVHATLQPALSFGRSVGRLVGRSVSRIVGHTLLFFMILFLWPHCSCLNGLVTSNMAPAHPHATSVAVYPALLTIPSTLFKPFLLTCQVTVHWLLLCKLSTTNTSSINTKLDVFDHFWLRARLSVTRYVIMSVQLSQRPLHLAFLSLSDQFCVFSYSNIAPSHWPN